MRINIPVSSRGHGSLARWLTVSADEDGLQILSSLLGSVCGNRRDRAVHDTSRSTGNLFNLIHGCSGVGGGGGGSDSRGSVLFAVHSLALSGWEAVLGNDQL